MLADGRGVSASFLPNGNVRQAPVIPQILPSNKIISDEVYQYFDVIINSWILTLISALGIVTNSLNVLVFIKQGFRDSINVSLMAITLWDFLRCLVGFLHRMYVPISLVSTVFATTWKNATFPYASYTPIFAGYVSYALTTYVSIERCLCVSRPFTVKLLFTPLFTFAMVTTISAVVFGSYAVMYFIYDVAFVFNARLNDTTAVYQYNSFYYKNQNLVMVYYKYVGILLPFGSFFILCVSSATTVYFLKKSSTFLKQEKRDLNVSMTSTKRASGISQREKQVVKMLLVVILVSIGTLLPRLVFYIAQLLEPELYLLRRYNNEFYVVAMWLFALDFVNASINLFIFLAMSSNYKSTFSSIFHHRDKKPRTILL
ncbi:uncharacterized protein LOC131938974 [Physella acuta]|uniref:uncharacterized protein LOC131938974 n=1 Tax=Physella acuta TaxID=109671 RepID=UPI0027DCE776|nr:uncharacterized protein LOC131938974 [Physella acuta]